MGRVAAGGGLADRAELADEAYLVAVVLGREDVYDVADALLTCISQEEELAKVAHRTIVGGELAEVYSR